MQAAVSEHLPAQPLVALWRLGESTNRSSGSTGGGSPELGPAAGEGEEEGSKGDMAEWESLACLVHMLTTGPGAGAGRAGVHALLVEGTRLPQALAVVASHSSSVAARYAASEGIAELAPQQRPQGLVALVDSLLQQAALEGGGNHDTASRAGLAAAAATAAAARAACVLWELCCPGATGRAAAVNALLRSTLLLPALMALLPTTPALEQQAGGSAAEQHAAEELAGLAARMAAGLLASMLWEPQPADAASAVAADGARQLLAGPHARTVLSGLVALLVPTSPALRPGLTPSAAAAAIANLTAGRGGTVGGPPRPAPRLSDQLAQLLSVSSSSLSSQVAPPSQPTQAAPQATPRPPQATPTSVALAAGALPALVQLLRASSAGLTATAAATSQAQAAAASSATPQAREEAQAAMPGLQEAERRHLAGMDAALLALSNLCCHPAGSAQLSSRRDRGFSLQSFHGRGSSRPEQQQCQEQPLPAALSAAMGDARLPADAQARARRLLLVLGSDGRSRGSDMHMACMAERPPARNPAYPRP